MDIKRIIRRLALTALAAPLLAGIASDAAPDDKQDGDRKERQGSRGQKPGDGSDRKRRPGEDGMPAWFRERLEALPPDERERVRDNWDRWRDMGPRERRELQQRALADMKRTKDEAERAVGEAGIELDREGRELFMLRYRQERRKIEETLREEFRERRDAMHAEMLSRLKTEFSEPRPETTGASESPGTSEGD